MAIAHPETIKNHAAFIWSVADLLRGGLQIPFRPCSSGLLRRSHPRSGLRGEMTRFSRGVASSRLRLYPDEFLRLSAPVPPLHEQARLAQDFADASLRGASVVELLRKQIELLVEHRQALITAAVTGELDIPGTAA